jgi:hypothetical protein
MAAQTLSQISYSSITFSTAREFCANVDLFDYEVKQSFTDLDEAVEKFSTIYRIPPEKNPALRVHLQGCLLEENGKIVSNRTRKAAKIWWTKTRTLKKSGQSSIETEKTKYRKLLAKRVLFLGVCIVLLFVIAGIALTLGSADMSFFEAYEAVFAKILPKWFHVSPLADTVVWTLRLPRILLAVLAGATLAMGGSTTQAILRNPLATPTL